MKPVLAGLAVCIALLAPAFADPSVARADAAPGAAELATRIKSFVSERARVDRDDVILPPLDDFELGDVEAPVEVRLSARPQERYAGLAPVTVSLVSRGRELKRGSVSVRVRRESELLVAARALPARTVIRASDVVSRRVDRAAPADAVRDASLLVGRQTTRSVAPGATWRHGLVDEVPVIGRGELVETRLQSGGLRIDGVARATADAAAGERVRVMNVETRRELVGTVDADGVVHVGR